jgi:hypothetical protein
VETLIELAELTDRTLCNQAEIEASYDELVVLAHARSGVGVATNRNAEDGSAFALGIGRHIGSSTGETQSHRRTSERRRTEAVGD